MASVIAQRSLINDIAAATALDQPLTNLVLQRPYVVQVIVAQCVYTARMITQLKSCCFGLLAEGDKPRGTSQQAPGTTTQGSNIPLSTANTRTTAFGLNTTTPTQPQHPPIQASFSSLQVRDPVCLVATPLQVHIVVVGCGSVGTKVVEGLMKTKVYHPSSISCVSRRPDNNTQFSSQGMRCFKRVCDAVGPETDMVILAVPPSQFPTVAKEIQQSGQLRPFATVMSVCCGISADKVASELKHPLTMTTSLDVDALARAVTVWKQEEDAAAEHTREKYGAAKKFATLPDTPLAPRPEDGQLMTVDEGGDFGDDEEEEQEGKRHYALQGRAFGGQQVLTKQQVRHRQILHQAFPREVEVFFNRFFFNMVLCCVARGVSVTDALMMVWTHMVPQGKQGFICGQPPLNAALFGPNGNGSAAGLKRKESSSINEMMSAEQLATNVTGATPAGANPKSPRGTKGPLATHGRLAALCTVTNLASHLGCTNSRVVVEDFKGRFFELLSTTGTGTGRDPQSTTLQ